MRHVEVFGEVHRRLTVRKPLPSTEEKKLLTSSSAPKKVPSSSSEANDDVLLSRHSDTEEDFGVRKRRRDLEKGEPSVGSSMKELGLLGLRERLKQVESDMSEDDRPEKKRKLQVHFSFFFHSLPPLSFIDPLLTPLTPSSLLTARQNSLFPFFPLRVFFFPLFGLSFSFLYPFTCFFLSEEIYVPL